MVARGFKASTWWAGEVGNAEAGRFLRVQKSQGYVERPCLKKRKTKQNTIAVGGSNFIQNLENQHGSQFTQHLEMPALGWSEGCVVPTAPAEGQFGF